MRVLVLGAAVSGMAAARLASEAGNEVSLYDQREVNATYWPIHCGEWRAGYLDGIDLVVTSPGFPEHEGPIPDVLASGVPLVSEMEYAVATMNATYAAVTGTNGKTTVTSVAANMLQASGRDAVAAGNIGNALSDIALDRAHELLVIEASSFQLRFVDGFHPAAAAILNIAPDHLDWHRDMAEYVAAKQRIFENQTPDDILVYDADDAGAVDAVVGAPARLVPVSGQSLPEGGGGVDGDAIIIAGERYPRRDFDRAYTVDLVAAGELAAHLGATPAGIGRAIVEFQPATHRRTAIGKWDGVSWVNDSKATNPHAAIAAVLAYDSVILIAGGRNKGLDLAPIVAFPRVRKVIGIGEAAAELEAVTEPERYVAAGSLEEAVAKADQLAHPGDTVLLAPGCASFDMFDSYAARGDEFRRLVLAIKGEGIGN